MNKNRLAASALALVVSFSACGCGDKIYELTDEEEAVIVHYSAHAVTKYNKRQTEGVEDITKLKAQMEEQQQEEEKKEEQKEQKKEEQQQEQQKTDTPSSQQDGADGQQAQYVSLSEALGLKGISASYDKYEVMSAYQESPSFIVSADSGNELLVLHISLKNSSGKTEKCNMIAKMPSFRLTVSGKQSVSADTTILLNDLGTYQRSIKAGETKKAVLVFQVKKGTAQSIDSMELEVTINGTSAQVQL